METASAGHADAPGETWAAAAAATRDRSSRVICTRQHLGRWAPLPVERGPPEPDWPPGAVIPLTYHPVPDIT